MKRNFLEQFQNLITMRSYPFSSADLKIGVVILTYNQEAFLIEQLKSLNGQTFLPAKVVVVNNNSSDIYFHAVEYSSVCEYIYIKLSPDSGPCKNAARNVGVDQCQGCDYVIVMDGDILLPKNVLRMVWFQGREDSILLLSRYPLLLEYAQKDHKYLALSATPEEVMRINVKKGGIKFFAEMIARQNHLPVSPFFIMSYFVCFPKSIISGFKFDESVSSFYFDDVALSMDVFFKYRFPVRSLSDAYCFHVTHKNSYNIDRDIEGGLGLLSKWIKYFIENPELYSLNRDRIDKVFEFLFRTNVSLGGIQKEDELMQKLSKVRLNMRSILGRLDIATDLSRLKTSL